MKKSLVLLSLFISYISYAQSNFPPCRGEYWNNCYGERKNEFGDNYIGNWKDNEYYGQGTYIFSGGGKYVGKWKDGKYHGQGILTFYDGGKYVGAFKNDGFNGYGTYYNSDGTIFQQGIWKDNDLVQDNTPIKSVTEMPRQNTGIDNERKKLEEERLQLAEERRKLEEEKRKFNTKLPVNNMQDTKRQRCLNLGLLPDSADFQQCMK
jgi:MORN repeat